MKNRAFSITELVVAVAIFAVIMVGVFSMGADIFSLNSVMQNSFTSLEEAKKIIKPMSNEIRSMSPSGLGAYPLVETGTSSLEFYSDINYDGKKEQVRYFLDDTTLKKGIIAPTGTPITYLASDEQFSELIHGVRNSDSNPVFEYYDTNYNGTSSSLIQPVSPVLVRLIKVTITIDGDVSKSPTSQTITTQVTLRNVKDNL
ncbi:MAG: prepilin-type N-terminal cleavage/methylation domain-containing protein [bacterium]